MSIRAIVDLSDQRAKRLLLDAIRATEGEHRVEVVRYRRRRTDRQNRFYWPSFTEPFAEWLSEQAGETVTADRAHDIFKETLLRVPVTDADGVQLFLPNGDALMRTRSTTELSTTEFNEYLDKCGQLMLDMGAVTELPEPRVYHEPVQVKGAA